VQGGGRHQQGRRLPHGHRRARESRQEMRHDLGEMRERRQTGGSHMSYQQ
jgi:hypothetical protein